jgi:hypothetical protein
MAERLDLRGSEIAALKHLAIHAGVAGSVPMPAFERTGGVLLWRRRLVQIWYRQSLDRHGLEGPFFSLTVDGMRLAAAFMAVPANRAATFSQLRKAPSKPAPRVPSQEIRHAASRI